MHNIKIELFNFGITFWTDRQLNIHGLCHVGLTLLRTKYTLASNPISQIVL